ncbi:MAG: SGNH/GDSL hydrolase family protein [Alphaproteobacteria bacterium]
MNRPAPRPAIRLIGWLLIVVVPLALVLAASELVLRAIGLGDPVLYDAHPAYGYAPHPNQQRERRRGAVVTIDSRGLRTPVDWRQPAAHHILFIGDSVTYGGSYVDDRELFSEQVCAGLAAHHDIEANCGNAGVNAYGVENMAARLAATDFGADMIVAVVLPGDALRGLNRLEGLPFHQSPMPPLLSATTEAAIFAWRFAKTRLRRWTTSSAAPVAPTSAEQVERAARRTEIIDRRLDTLIEVLRLHRADGTRVLLVLTPGRVAVSGDDPLTNEIHDRLAATGLPYLDMRPHLRGADLDRLYYDAVHLNPPGHALYGEVLTARIATELAAP